MADELELEHYGTPRHSGRYPWGSGKDPQQHHRDFLGEVDRLRKKGMSSTEIAKGFGMTTTQLRAKQAIAKNEVRKSDAEQALRLKDKGMSNVAIGKQMGINESSVRSLLDPAMAEKRDILETTANLLKDKMGDGYLDVGAGTENHLGISDYQLSTAVARLKAEGYEVHNIQVDQLGTRSGQKTTINVLSPPGTKYVDIVRNPNKIKTVAAYSDDGGRTFEDILPPRNISSNRISVRYAEDGGANADGVIYVRRGVPDVSLGSARYAQVRIAVDGTHYLKGMAMYKDDMPAGSDLLFNTNKSRSVGKLGAMKAQKDDEENPFGATVHQLKYTDAEGKEQRSVMNIVNEEGNWKDWSRSLSSQMLSKQSTELASKQLNLALKSRQDEFDEIKSLTNPVVKKKLLTSFADGAESASVHLKAAALPGQGTHVILPIESMKETEIHAPNYENGTKVVLIRFPHGGTFEIPELTVNNKNKEARSTIGTAIDAVGIHPKVAQRLSGADFDGDTVLVIPNNNRMVKTSSALKDLEGFDPQSYKIDRESGKPAPAKISPRAKQQQMGDVSNLITDMTIKGAKPEELARAVKHSMVVIDAEKHDLNYKQSAIDNGIASLKEKYQGRGPTGRLSGASTIISKSGNATVKVPDKKLRTAAQGGAIDPLTGKKVFVETGATYVDRVTGKTKTKLIESKPLLETDNAHTLSSGTPMEHIYAEYSNNLKALANSARKEALQTGGINYSPTASKTYAREVASLGAKLNIALKNKPLERQAQLIANSIVATKTRDNPGMEQADLKKIKSQALQVARDRVGVTSRNERQVNIEPKEWEAIQAGAITTNKLTQILDQADLDKVKELATPRTQLTVTPVKLARAKAMLSSGYTQAEIAKQLGVATSTLNDALLNERGSSG